MPNQIRKNGASTRIGTVPAVIVTGSRIARSQLEARGDQAEAVPTAPPIATAISTFAVV